MGEIKVPINWLLVSIDWMINFNRSPLPNIKRLDRVVTQDWQKSYVDRCRRPLEFHEGDHVFLKVSLKLGQNRPFKEKKLSMRYIDLYQILSRVGEVVYQLALQSSSFRLHDVFHVSHLRKFIPDTFQPILPYTIEVVIDLTFQPQPSPHCILFTQISNE